MEEKKETENFIREIQRLRVQLDQLQTLSRSLNRVEPTFEGEVSI